MSNSTESGWKNARQLLGKACRASSYVRVPALVDAAKSEALALTLRHDVPVGPFVPADLKDERGRFFGTPDGFRIAGRMLVDDLLMGSPSPTIPFLFALLPFLTLATVVLAGFLGTFGLVVGGSFLAAAVWTLNASVQRTWMLVGLAMGIVVPLLLGQGLIFHLVPEGILRALFDPRSPLHGVAMKTMYAGVIGGLAAATGAVWFFARDRSAASRFATWSICILAAFLISVTVLPAFLKPLFWFGFGTLPALLYTRAQKRNRALRLAYQGQRATMESTGTLQHAHVKPREDQVEKAKYDDSSFVQLGVAMGVFTLLHDGYAPDKGLPFGLTINDLGQHLVVFGASGTGKASRVLRPLLQRVMAERALNEAVGRALTGRAPTGLVLMDGKGSLAIELRGVPGYTLIEPGCGINVALIEGLSPQEVAETLRDLSSKDDEASSDTAAHFKDNGYTYLVNAALMLEAFTAADRKRCEKEGGERAWRWTVKDLARVSNLMAAASEKYEGSEIESTVGDLLANYGLVEDRYELLVAAINYVEDTLTHIDIKERSGIISTANRWLNTLLLDERILPWSGTEQGFDVTQVLYGAWIGVNLPELKYQRTGKLVQGLLKRRIFNALRDRADRNWEALGESPVIFVIDEAHELVTRADRTMLPVARSLGGRMVYATQHFESFSVAFGGESFAHRFLADFSSWVAFRASFKTYEWVSSRLGEVNAYVASEQGQAIDFRFTAKLALDSPLHDPSHPMRSQLRDLRLQGGGSVDERLLRERAQVSSKSARGRELFDPSERMDETTLMHLAIRPVTAGEWKKRPLLEPQDWSAYTAEDGVAVSELMRAGCRRRDVIRCAYVGSLAETLMEGPTADGIAKPAESSNVG